MAAPISTALPTAPATSDSPDVFEEKAFAFVGALEPFRVDLQAQADFVNDNVGPGSDAETVANIAADVTTVAGVASDITQLVDNGWVKPFATLADAASNLNIDSGDTVNLKERESGKGEGGIWYVISGTGTADGRDIVAHDTLSLSFVKRDKDEPLGLRVTRSNNNNHYGWGSTAVLSDGRWMQIFRSANTHATEDNAQLMMHWSDNEGQTWYGEKEIYRNASHDARPAALWKMANGRIGLTLNRAGTAGAPYADPLFMYTDDDGDNWSSVSIPMTSTAYSFQATGGIMEWPASQGGHDTLGFITYGYASSGQKDALTTDDNGATWSIVQNIHDTGAVMNVSGEWAGCRIGATDRWLFYVRGTLSGVNTDYASVFATTDMLDWGAPISSAILNKGTPPAVVYNEDTGNVDCYVVERGGKDLYNYDNALLVASENAETLWSNSGVYTRYPSLVAEMPGWFTGYLKPFIVGRKKYFTLMFGENKSAVGDAQSAVGVLGYMKTTAKDAANVAKLHTRRIEGVSVDLKGDTNTTTDALVFLNNSAETVLSKYGPYEDRHAMSGVEYLSNFSDDYRINADGYLYLDSVGAHLSSQNVIIGSSSNEGGITAACHMNVSSASSGSLASHADGTSSARTHVQFTNSNGVVGSISTSGTATAYNTSSDPRLKTEFETAEYDEIKSVLNKLYNCCGKFKFKNDLSTDVIGFDAHKVLDIDGLGSEIATPGNGPRDKNIGDVYGADEDGTQLKVTSASVDHSKLVPYLLVAVKNLIDRVEYLESK